MLYRIPIEDELTTDAESVAITHCKYRGGWTGWLEHKERFPKQFARMIIKRGLRLAWYQRHGSIPKGWCPPLGDGQSNRRPVQSLRKRLSKRQRKNPFAEVFV